MSDVTRDPRTDPKAGDIVRRIHRNGDAEVRLGGWVGENKGHAGVRFWDAEDGEAEVNYRDIHAWRVDMVGGEVVRAVA